MTSSAVERVINSVMYEGYLLYPYRASATKNRHRFNFGIVFPPPAQPAQMTAECVMQGDETLAVEAEIRFLQVVGGTDGEEVVERRVGCNSGGAVFDFEGLSGAVDLAYSKPAEGCVKVQVRVSNTTSPPSSAGAGWNESLSRCLVSMHILLHVRHGAFISLLDPPEEFQQAAAQCNQEGCWPVLIGRKGERDYMLAAPIILYDYPSIAPESPLNLFDGTEIDEILLLRILSLSPAEKDEISKGDPRGRRILERAEALTPEDMRKLHGATRHCGVKRGDRVRLHPRPGADALDVLLAGRIGIIEAIEEDFESRTHIAVVIEDDPGIELGLARMPGHRFFFSPEEVEVLE